MRRNTIRGNIKSFLYLAFTALPLVIHSSCPLEVEEWAIKKLNENHFILKSMDDCLNRHSAMEPKHSCMFLLGILKMQSPDCYLSHLPRLWLWWPTLRRGSICPWTESRLVPTCYKSNTFPNLNVSLLRYNPLHV